MNLLVLGRGKTGAAVAEIARARQHQVSAVGSADNSQCGALTPEKLKDVDVVIDFTTPDAVMANMAACLRTRKNMVVGTTGWYEHLPAMKREVQATGTGLVYGANFSVGVNLFFDVAQTAAVALKQNYFGQVFERHHSHKKDAPSGTAILLRQVIQEAAGEQLEITSYREGEVVGMHEVIFSSANDTIYLCHDAKSRRGFAEGAVKAAEWIAGKQGFFDFREIWREL
jgi:4-hydroxy-tetrahydrodipicolinate reductase